MMIPDGRGQMQEQIDFSKTSQIKCEACGCSTFKQTLLLRKMSALVAPGGQETIIQCKYLLVKNVDMSTKNLLMWMVLVNDNI